MDVEEVKMMENLSECKCCSRSKKVNIIEMKFKQIETRDENYLFLLF